MTLLFDEQWHVIAAKLTPGEALIVKEMLEAQRNEISLDLKKISDNIAILERDKDNPESKVKKELLQAQASRMRFKVKNLDTQIKRLEIKTVKTDKVET